MEPYPFKFKWLNQQGQPQGFASKKGRFDGEMLVLDEAQIPSEAIIHVDCRENRVVVAAASGQNEQVNLLFILTKGSADKLKELLGQARSRAWARRHREQLVAAGRGSEYRDATCPHCQAAIDLSGFPKTPQVSCDFCPLLSG
jgi:hypothetical protein